MGKDFESWLRGLHQQQRNGQFSDAKSLKLPLDLGVQNLGIPCSLPCTDAVPPSYDLPSFGFPELLNFKMGQFKEPHGWFNCLPCFRQDLIPEMSLHEKFLPEINIPGKVFSSVNENCREVNTLTAAGRHASKQFIVVDHTGNKTTMIYSSGIGAPIQQLSSWYSKPTSFNNVSKDELKIGSSEYYHSGPNVTNELDEDGTDGGSEIPEDTEEINALLYSDDDNCSEDDEETSTGHSPSTMTANEKQYWFEEEDMDEVASSGGFVKKQKLSGSGHEVPSVTYTSISVEPDRLWEYEDAAESSCADGKPTRCSDGLGSLSGKRPRDDKIHDTVSMLRTIIPGGKDKDVIMVLDEAIEYLRTLKFKAKALELSAL